MHAYDQDGHYATYQRVLRSSLEVFNKPAERVAIWRAYLELAREAEQAELVRYQARRVSIGLVHRARYERLDAELQLLRAKRPAEAAAGK